jgi:hypothetical protein
MNLLKKHTPGPWKPMRSQSYGPLNTVYGPDKKSVASLGNARMRSTEEMEANTRLIAAAPELLRTLKDAVALLGCDHPKANHCAVCTEAKAAIELADGK